jgi:D-serine deaminase-like pyridoxal phosphate-dependent protein
VLCHWLLKSQKQSKMGDQEGTKFLGTVGTPAFVVSREALQQNCDSVLNVAKSKSIGLRVHVKTHKTVEATIAQTRGCFGTDDVQRNYSEHHG